jgi:Undecaprenyl-phosphate galactose phosphotransferase WbaP
MQVRSLATPQVKPLTQPFWTRACLLVSDLSGLGAAAFLAIAIRAAFDGFLDINNYTLLLPALALFIVAFALVGLYRFEGLHPVEELRLFTVTTTLVYLLLGAGSFLFKNADVYSRGIFVGAWLLSLLLLPLSRAAWRAMFARSAWWGASVVIFGAGQTGRLVVEALRKRPGLGLKPFAFLDDDPSKPDVLFEVPVLGNLDRAHDLARLGLRHAMIAMPGATRARLLEVIENHGGQFPSLLIIPDLIGVASLWAGTRDLGGVLGLEVRQNLLLPGSKRLKRSLDLLLLLLLAPLILPVCALIALLIALDSKGAVIYRSPRVGLGGRVFNALKFRTMHTDADAHLQRILEQDSALRQEWQTFQKLKRDPRVTRVGRWLRRSSLDELPQLWNVLIGEMSVVGPRPILDNDQRALFGKEFNLYTKVLPGMTGLWQVSGRNALSFAERVRLDSYYARNWSPWLDIYILSCTPFAVIKTGEAS